MSGNELKNAFDDSSANYAYLVVFIILLVVVYIWVDHQRYHISKSVYNPENLYGMYENEVKEYNKKELATKLQESKREMSREISKFSDLDCRILNARIAAIRKDIQDFLNKNQHINDEYCKYKIHSRANGQMVMQNVEKIHHLVRKNSLDEVELQQFKEMMFELEAASMIILNNECHGVFNLRNIANLLTEIKKKKCAGIDGKRSQSLFEQMKYTIGVQDSPMTDRLDFLDESNSVRTTSMDGERLGTQTPRLALQNKNINNMNLEQFSGRFADGAESISRFGRKLETAKRISGGGSLEYEKNSRVSL